MTTTNFIAQLKNRGLIAQTSHEEELNQILSKSHLDEKGIPYSVYCGLDPTARSLHVGNLVQLMMLRRAQDAGLTPIILLGGATGLIGDPTGRTEMRPMNTKDQIEGFVENFKILASRYFRFDVENKPIFVNNMDWFSKMSWIDFARNIGVHFTVARLLSAEVNKTRFQEGGLTFMELSYQLMQSYDFLNLYQSHNCIVQFGGDDQWSNILGGADLIRRVVQGKAFAITTPLLVGSDGKKFGKTAGNAIWLDESMTSPYEYYQFFRNTHDDDVEKMLKIFTFKTDEEIQSILKNHDINQAKETMAFEITKVTHGQQHAESALQTARALFSGKPSDFSAAPTTFLMPDEISTGIDILSLLIKCNISNSRGEARKLIQGGGLSFNGEKLSDASYQLKEQDFQTEQNALVLRKGKKDFHLVKIS